MRGKNTQKDKKSNIKPVLAFLVGVFLLVGISLGLRVFKIILQSKFNGASRFTIVICYNKEIPKALKVVSVDPTTVSVSVVDFTDVKTVSQTQRFMGIPFDGVIVFPKREEFLQSADLSQIFTQSIFHYKNIDSSITIIDLLRLRLFMGGVSYASVKTFNISTKLTDKEVDRKLFPYFADSEIIKEKLSIEVVNGSETTGLGSKLGRVIANFGGDVISISTSSVATSSSHISFSSNKSYTVKRLSQILRLPLVINEKSGISDIIVVIGKDYKNISF